MTTDNNEALPAAPEREAGRRTVLRGAGLAGGAVVAAAALTACGGGSSGSSGTAGGGSSASGSTGAASADSGSIAASKVPVGSGVIDDDLKAVVTQPAKGEFKAFSYVCTHRGCPVTQISGDTITCPCHGSEFSTKDGSVKQGPATKPLASKKATVKGARVIIS